jgi:phosphatidylglycerophosphate synthase
MRKIPEEYDDNIDNKLIPICEKLCPYFNKMNFTPNMITTIGNIIFIIAVYLFYKDHYLSAGILYFIVYFFDCLDGHYARKYNQCTKLGDLYDHCSDTVKFFVIIFFIYLKTKNLFLIGFILLITFFTLVHLGCQEQVYGNSENGHTLSTLKGFCKKDPHNMIKITRNCGVGTMTLIISLIIIFNQKFRMQ